MKIFSAGESKKCGCHPQNTDDLAYMKYGVFPDDGKIASVIPLDKCKPNKNEISNFRPVNLLNTFSKIYEKVIKDQLVSGLDKYFSPFISAYRKGLNMS